MSGSVSDRKMRLFVAACARSLHPVFGDQQETVAVMQERYADGQATEADLLRVLTGVLFEHLFPEGVVPSTYKPTPIRNSVRDAARTATDFTHVNSRDNTEEEKARICNLVRDIFNPFRLVVTLDGGLWVWNDGIVKRLAEAAYQERQDTTGYLDRARLAILADALEEAGCDDDLLVGHLRAEESHVRGCWAVDLLLKKE
jgi:hypothetical protein